MRLRSDVTRSASLLLSVVLGLVAAGAAPETASPAASLKEQGTKVVDLIIAGKFTDAVRGFNAAMTTALPPGKLREAWEALTKQVGPYKDHGEARTGTEQGYQVVYVPCRFEKAAVDAKVVYDARGQVAGLFFLPPK